MYKQILVAVDNSTWSDDAVAVALEMAGAYGASVTGNHVYAARLHDLRFRQLEPGLPERYQSEEVLARQRAIHDSLIGRGLAIISDSYLDVVESRCREAGVPFTRQACEGQNYAELVRVVNEDGYDLVALGAYGLGRCKRTLVGSVCERTVRRTTADALVVRQRQSLRGAKIAVAVDGSDCSFAAVRRAVGLAKTFGASLTALAVYDPFFHRVAFGSIAGVLSEEAAKLFKFREQEVLHDEVIDSGLMGLYQAHLDRAATMAAAAGVPVQTKVLQGKPYDVLLDYAEEETPALLVLGRVGFHHVEGAEIGSNTENVLQLAACNLLIVGEREDDAEAVPNSEPEERVSRGPVWMPEARAQMERIPPFVRSMARRVIEGHARQKGYVVITPTVADEARRRFGM